MANKRMFSLSVVDTDQFLEMPITSRLLYYELGMRADDDGFVDNWKKIIRMALLSEDDMKILAAKKFIIPFESGVIVIRHWRLNNYLKNDRAKPTIYQDELSQLMVNESNIYELGSTEKSACLQNGYKMDTKCIQNGDTDKNSIDKNSIDKNSIGEDRVKNTRSQKPNLEEIEKYINEKKLNVNAKHFFDYFETGNWIDSNGNKVKNWKQKLLTWNNHNVERKSQKENETSNPFLELLKEERNE